MTLALCTALRVCWTVDGMWQLGYYLLFRLPPTIPCIACDLLSLSGAEVEQRVQLSHLSLWENFCPRELNGILFFLWRVYHIQLVFRKVVCQSGLSPETAGDRCIWKGKQACAVPICAFGSSPLFSPNVCFVVFTVVVCSVVFVCLTTGGFLPFCT